MSDTTGAQSDAAVTGDAAGSTSWKQAKWSGVVAYLLARLCVVAGAAAVSTARDVADRLNDPTKLPPESALGGIFDVLNSWDGQWYYAIVRNGYPRQVPPHVTFEVLEARAAFFPLYPMLVRGLNAILPGGDVLAALLFNSVMGLVAVLLVGELARRIYGVEVAKRAMLLMALFPGSYVFSFAYSEAVMFVLVALCLLALNDRRWVWAGVAAALVTASRPNGVAICFATAVAAWFAIRERREWRALIAPALSPLGWLTFQIWLGVHASETGVWFRVQREAWDEGLSFGMKSPRGHRRSAGSAHSACPPTC
ncbi:MAG: glycosyltransferase family 39 protein [Ilumatobacteraceae bacterium]